MRSFIIAGVIACGLAGSAAAQPARQLTQVQIDARIHRILAATPLIDGHNDFPWEMWDRYKGDITQIDLNSDLSHISPPPDKPDLPPLMTDIPRLRAGGLGAQFWSVYVPAELQGAASAEAVHRQIDIVRRMVAAYPRTFELATSADDIERIHRAGRIASMLGMEGGEPINSNLAVLRDFRAEGVLYMTLTHSKNTAWADSATDKPEHPLTAFGHDVIVEMNHIGMLVDLSHVSARTMNAVLDVATAPVIFSHSSAYALCHHPRNVPDDVLRRLQQNGGVVMVNFYPGFISEALRLWNAEDAAETARQKSLNPGDPVAAASAVKAWEQAHPHPNTTVSDVADHIEHIRDVAGIDHVGIGSDFDGVPFVPIGLEGVDGYPHLLAELMRRGWSDADLAKLAGGNLLRALREAERVARTTR